MASKVARRIWSYASLSLVVSHCTHISLSFDVSFDVRFILYEPFLGWLSELVSALKSRVLLHPLIGL